MTVGELCNRAVVFAREEETVRVAARRMRDMHVGDVVIVREEDGSRVPVGIVTDRDLVVGPLAAGSDTDAATIAEVMGPRLVTATDKEDLSAALQRMRVHGIRRLPVVDEGGALKGILTMDDALEFLDQELAEIARLVIREQKREMEHPHAV